MAKARAFAKETQSNFVHAYVPPSPRLQPPCPAPILTLARGNPDYGDKRTCNRRLGPGGGTRRLHQHPRHCGTMGPKQDRRTFKEASFRSVRYHRYRSKITVANDNRAPVAMAA